MAENFNFAAGDIGVSRSCRPSAHLACDLQAVFIADRFSDFEHFRAVRIADNLGQTLAVAQIDKNNAAVVAPAMRPAAKSDFLADRLGIELPAVMSSHTWFRNES